jgi:hypothetical protein
MPSLRVGTWNIAGARREGTNQVDLDAVAAGIQAQVAGVEAVGDPSLGLVQHRGLRLHRPVTGKGPMVKTSFRSLGVGRMIPRRDDAG